MKKQTVVTLSAVALLLAFAAGAWWFQGYQAEKVGRLARESASTLVPDHAMSVGPKTARVVIVEFFDPACETCASLHKPVERLVAAYPGRVRHVLRYAPFHHGSDLAVKILEASRKQGKYWETLELLFTSQQRWTKHHKVLPDMIWPLLPQVGLDVDRIRSDITDSALDTLIEQDLADAATLGIRKTPGFLVNGKPLPSFGLKQLWDLVESEIAANY